MNNADVIVIGAGLGGLVAGALLARYGKRVIVCESHTRPGGAAHGFVYQGFRFDTGPSFYCGLSDRTSLNPLRQVLDVLEESVPAVAYDPLGHYHFPEGIFPVYGNASRYRQEIAKVTPQGAIEFAQFEQRLSGIYSALKEIPAIALRADWQVIPTLLGHIPALLKCWPYLMDLSGSVADCMGMIKDPWVRRLIDLECFLLSGLTAAGTIAPEVAFMMGERDRSVIDYPIGGSEAIVDALVRGLEKWGGSLRLKTPVEQIQVTGDRVTGVGLQNGECLTAPIVISNATIWDTYIHLLKAEDVPSVDRKQALETPAVDSFMHLHLGIEAEGLEDLTGHHVVLHDAAEAITTPGNTCMISIPSVWDASLAPIGCHGIHAYSLEPYAGWQRDDRYEGRKRERAESLFRAVERVIPDVRRRIKVELIGTPLTHAHYLRRYQGTYGPAIAAKQGAFPGPATSIKGLYRVGDSTSPGIGVPAVAASGILCANTLVSPSQTQVLLQALRAAK